MDLPPALAVILVNWNTKDLLDRCLGGLEASSGDSRAQIVVIDNASTDGSAEFIRRRHPRIRLIANGENEGFARAVNRGLAATTQDLVLVLNPDAMPTPGAIRSMIELMRSDPTIGIVGPRLIGAGDRPQISVANHPSLATELLHKPMLSRLLPGRFYSRHYQPDSPVQVETVIGACMLLNRAMLREIGDFDESYFLFLEETDLCLRARRAGWKVVFHPKVRVLHHQGASATQAEIRARVEYARSLAVYFAKHHSPMSGRLLAAGLWIRKIINALYFGLLSPFSSGARRKFKAQLSLLGWHLLGQPEGWGLRPVDHSRTASDHAYRPDQQGVLWPVRRS